MRAAIVVFAFLVAAAACAPRYPYDWPSDYTRAPIDLTIHRGGLAHVQFRTAPAARCGIVGEGMNIPIVADSLGNLSVYQAPAGNPRSVHVLWRCEASGHGGLPDIPVTITVVPKDVPAPEPTRLQPTRHQIDAASAKDGVDVLTGTNAELAQHGVDPRPPDPTGHAYAMWLGGIVSSLETGVPLPEVGEPRPGMIRRLPPPVQRSAAGR